jgi:glycosyltransferase involved in cell wall biosynthesis
MQNIVLVTNKLFHYRVPVYNYFSIEFEKRGYHLIVLSNDIQQDIPDKINFEYQIIPFKYSLYTKKLKEISPCQAILFLHIKDLIFIELIYWFKKKKIPVINWTHGVNLADANNKIRNSVFHFFHNLSDAIVLYSPNEKKYIQKKNHQKCFIANNTIDFNNFSDIVESKEELKKAYQLDYKKIVLFVGRIQPRKRLDDLIDIFTTPMGDHTGLVIVGPGLTEKQQHTIEHTHSITYLGEIYDENEINRIHKMSDIFCIPGANGLGLNLAMYWGLPCITYKNSPHGPELWYLIDSFNGYILEDDTPEALKSSIMNLLGNEDRLQEMSDHAKKHILTEGNINKMFLGFVDAMSFCLKKPV